MPHKSKIPFGPDVTPFFYKDRWIWITYKKPPPRHLGRVRGVWRAKIENYRGDVLYGKRFLMQSKWQFAETVLRFVDGLIRREKETGIKTR